MGKRKGDSAQATKDNKPNFTDVMFRDDDNPRPPLEVYHVIPRQGYTRYKPMLGTWLMFGGGGLLLASALWTYLVTDKVWENSAPQFSVLLALSPLLLMVIVSEFARKVLLNINPFHTAMFTNYSDAGGQGEKPTIKLCEHYADAIEFHTMLNGVIQCFAFDDDSDTEYYMCSQCHRRLQSPESMEKILYGATLTPGHLDTSFMPNISNKNPLWVVGRRYYTDGNKDEHVNPFTEYLPFTMPGVGIPSSELVVLYDGAYALANNLTTWRAEDFGLDDDDVAELNMLMEKCRDNAARGHKIATIELFDARNKTLDEIEELMEDINPSFTASFIVKAAMDAEAHAIN